MTGFYILALLLLLAFERSLGCLTGINGLPGLSGFFPFGNNQQPGIPAGIPSPQIPSPNGQSLPGQAAQVGGVGRGTNGVPGLGALPQLPSQIGQTPGQNVQTGSPGVGTNGLPSSNTIGKRESGFFPFGNSQQGGQRGILLPPLRQTSSDGVSPQNGQAGGIAAGTNGNLPSLSAIQKRESDFFPFGNNQQGNSGMPSFPNLGQNNNGQNEGGLGGLPNIGSGFGGGFGGISGSTGGFPFANGRGSSNGGFQLPGMGGSNQIGVPGTFSGSSKSSSDESTD